MAANNPHAVPVQPNLPLLRISLHNFADNLQMAVDNLQVALNQFDVLPIADPMEQVVQSINHLHGNLLNLQYNLHGYLMNQLEAQQTAIMNQQTAMMNHIDLRLDAMDHNVRVRANNSTAWGTNMLTWPRNNQGNTPNVPAVLKNDFGKIEEGVIDALLQFYGQPIIGDEEAHTKRVRLGNFIGLL